MIILLAESEKSMGEAYNVGNDTEEVKIKRVGSKDNKTHL